MKKQNKIKTFEQVKFERDAKNIDKFIQETLVAIRKGAHLDDYEIGYRFSTKKRTEHNREVCADINVDPEYLSAELTLYPEVIDLFRHDDSTRIKKVLCHELAHIRTERLVSLATKRFASKEEIERELETLTELLGRYMFKEVFIKQNDKPKK